MLLQPAVDMETLADLQRVLKERVASTMAECESSPEKTIESIEKNIARLEVGTVAAKATTLKTAATVADLVALKALLLDKAEAEGHMHKDTRVLLIEMVEYIQSTKDKLKERDQAAKAGKLKSNAWGFWRGMREMRPTTGHYYTLAFQR